MRYQLIDICSTCEEHDFLEEHKYNIAVRQNEILDGRQRAFENK